MAYKDPEQRRKYSREWQARKLAEDPGALAAKRQRDRERYWRRKLEAPDDLRAKHAIYAKRLYWKNPEKVRARKKQPNYKAKHKEQARARRERLADSYVRRCLVERGWSKQETEWAFSNPELLETIRTQIKLKREIRHGNQQPV